MSEKLFEMETWQIYALNQMEFRAKELGIKRGVALVFVEKRGLTTGKIMARPINRAIKRGSVKEGDPGTNYWGVAHEKLAYMISEASNSGVTSDVIVKNGETKYRGGVFCQIDNFRLYTVFSGASEDHDTDVAMRGMILLTANEPKG